MKLVNICAKRVLSFQSELWQLHFFLMTYKKSRNISYFLTPMKQYRHRRGWWLTHPIRCKKLRKRNEKTDFVFPKFYVSWIFMFNFIWNMIFWVCINIFTSTSKCRTLWGWLWWDPLGQQIGWRPPWCPWPRENTGPSCSRNYTWRCRGSQFRILGSKHKIHCETCH